MVIVRKGDSYFHRFRYIGNSLAPLASISELAGVAD
jgi:hypothetical protein